MAKIILEDIQKGLLQFVSENIVDESNEVGIDTPFRDAGIDSFSIIQIVLFVERKYGFSMAEGDLNPENLKSVSSIAEFIFKHEGWV